MPGATLRLAVFDTGGGELELLEYMTPPSPVAKPLPLNALGAEHVAFRVEGIEQKVKELAAKGVEFLSPIQVVEEGPLAGWHWVYFKDPDGITMELIEVDERVAMR